MFLHMHGYRLCRRTKRCNDLKREAPIPEREALVRNVSLMREALSSCARSACIDRCLSLMREALSSALRWFKKKRVDRCLSLMREALSYALRCFQNCFVYAMQPCCCEVHVLVELCWPMLCQRGFSMSSCCTGARPRCADMWSLRCK